MADTSPWYAALQGPGAAIRHRVQTLFDRIPGDYSNTTRRNGQVLGSPGKASDDIGHLAYDHLHYRRGGANGRHGGSQFLGLGHT